MKKGASLLYIAAFLFIGGWWGFMLWPSTPPPEIVFSPPPPKWPHTSPSLLSDLNRERIKKALEGSIDEMGSLIAEWDLDASLLESQGCKGIERLSHEDFLRAELIARVLKSPEADIEKAFITKTLEDDSHQSLSLLTSPHRFLPQTYLAASLLLALTSPLDIVALPQNFDASHSFYSPALLDSIPLKIDPYHTERLYKSSPDIAFIANYSSHVSIASLKAQNIPLFVQNSPKTSDELLLSIRRMGHIVSHPLKGELLALFVEAAFFSLDNRLKSEAPHFKENHIEKIMLLEAYSKFSLPMKGTLQESLLHHLTSIHPFVLPSYSSIDQEKLLRFNPDCLLLITRNGNSPKPPHITARHLFFLDELSAHDPSQFSVLAYFDIVLSLITAAKPLS